MKHLCHTTCLALLLFASGSAMGQHAADSLLALGLTEAEAIGWLEENTRSPGEDPRNLYHWFFELSEHYTDERQWEKGLQAVEQCIAIGIENGWQQEDVFRDAVSDKGAYLLELDRIRAAERWIRSYIDEVVQDWRYVKMCMLYASVLESLGDLNLAEDYLLKALQISRDIGDDRYASRTLVRLSQLYFKAEDLNGANAILKILDDPTASISPHYRMSIMYNLSAVFLQAGEYRRVIPLLDEIIQYGITNDLDQFAMLGLLNRGYAERESGQPEKARRSFELVLAYGAIDHYAYNNLAEIYLNEGMADSAVHYSRLALKIAGFDPDAPTTELAAKALSHPDKASFITLADDLARDYMALGEQDGRSKALQHATNLYIVLDTVIDEMRMTTAEQQSRHFWRTKVKPVYDRAISASFRNGNINKAFYFSEKSKGVLLLDDIVKHSSVRGGNIPDALLDEEFRLKQAIFDLELALHQGGPNTDSLADALLAGKRRLNDLLLEIAEIAPQYVSTRYQPTVSGIDEWLRLHGGSGAAVSYIWTDDRIYRFAIGDGRSTMDVMDVDSQFQAQLDLVLKTISRPTTRLDELKACYTAANALYNTLLGDLEFNLEKLTIFPDGPLYFLPFEALVVNSDPDDPRFLIEEATIHYGFSVNTMYAGGQAKGRGSVLAFAPNTYAEPLGLLPLKYMDRELGGLRTGRKNNTLWLTGEHAGRDTFLSAFENASLIHIYSHAAANDTSKPYPWIASRSDLIFLPEIYNHRTGANLVILSACETNLGEEVKGEGVISLARGFFHAGARSVLASLWSMNDQSNSDIIHNFYDELARGKSKAEALRAAKLKFMKDHPLEAGSPYHWAGLVYIGQDGPSPLKGSRYSRWPIALGIALFLAAFLSAWRRNSRRGKFV